MEIGTHLPRGHTEQSFLVTCLQLVEAVYMPSGDVAASIDALASPDADASWTCQTIAEYGESLLAAVATFGVTDTLAPVIAVVIRGTDVSVPSYLAVAAQVLDDVLVDGVQPVPWTSPNDAQIADGTSDAYGDLESVNLGTDGLPVSLRRYVYNLAMTSYQTNGVCPGIFVIGHSLGGALADVYAPAIAFDLVEAGIGEPTVFPYTFAAPTAGDANFVANVNDLVFAAVRVVNEHDVVPLAWNNIGEWNTIYDVGEFSIQPDAALAAAISVTSDVVGQFSYTPFSPVVTKKSPIYGSLGSTFTGEAELQHAATTYMTLIEGENIPGYPPEGISPLA